MPSKELEQDDACLTTMSFTGREAGVAEGLHGADHRDSTLQPYRTIEHF